MQRPLVSQLSRNMAMTMRLAFAILLPLRALCESQDSHNYNMASTLWTDDLNLVKEQTVPSGIRCGAWCSTLGLDCTVYDFNPDSGLCRVGVQVLVTSLQEIADTLSQRRPAMTRRVAGEIHAI